MLTNKIKLGAAFAAVAMMLAAGAGSAAATPSPPGLRQGDYGDYWIDYEDQHTRSTFGFSNEGTEPKSVDCSETGTGGVATAWTLRERNRRDFRRSTITCMELSTEGDLVGSGDLHHHFSYPGRGSLHTTAIDLDTSLPTGVGVVESWVGPTLVAKVKDVSMYETEVDDILAERYAGSWSGKAIGRSGVYEDLLACEPGYVLTGVDIWAKNGAGGNNQAEIRQVEVTCSRLVKNPTITADRIDPSNIPRP